MMTLLCPEITLTWYPGAVGSIDDPLLLLDGTKRLVGEHLAGLAAQLVDVQEGHRWATPNFWPRGNVRNELRWTEARPHTSAASAQAEAFALRAGLPAVVGWILAEIDGDDTTWSIAPAAIRQVEDRYDARAQQLLLTWSVDAGALAIYDAGETPPAIYPDGEILAGPTGTPTNRGAFLLGPNRTYPEA